MQFEGMSNERLVAELIEKHGHVFRRGGREAENLFFQLGVSTRRGESHDRTHCVTARRQDVSKPTACCIMEGRHTAFDQSSIAWDRLFVENRS